MNVSTNSERNLRKRRQTLPLKAHDWYIKRIFIPGIQKLKKTHGLISPKSKIIEKKNKNIIHSNGSMYLRKISLIP